MHIFDTLPIRNKFKIIKWSELVQLYREPTITYSITPNNSPELKGSSHNERSHYRRGQKGDNFNDFYEKNINSDSFLSEIAGLFSKFYIPERIRFVKNGVKIKLNDVVSYKIVYQNSTMKFFLTIPERFSSSFINAIKQDWGNVDITPVESGFIRFDPINSKAMDIVLKHHHALSIKHEKRNPESQFYHSLSGLGITLLPTDKVIIDFNINPIGEEWKMDARDKFNMFKNGKAPEKVERTLGYLLWSVFKFTNTLMDETINMISDLMGANKDSEKDNKALFEPQYTVEKLNPNSKGYEVQIRAIAESEDIKRSKYLLKNVKNCFEVLDGDNKFTIRYIRTKKGIKSIIKAVDDNLPQLSKGKDIFCERELNEMIRLPDKNTLKEYRKIITQDNFTRTEIIEDFFDDSHDALPFAKTLDKDSKILHFPSYERSDWNSKGRYVKDKTKIDDRCTSTLAFGRQGSGKTQLAIRQILDTFGANITDKEEWKRRSKSVVAFDVADGEIITQVWNMIPDWMRDRVNIINHSVPERPIQVNFADLEEFNRTIMHDPDYAYSLAELEASLISDVLETNNSILVNRWFTYALQCAHTASKDYGIPEAIRLLIDDDFRINNIIPNIDHDEELMLHMEAYNEMRLNGETSQIVTAIQNRLSQLSSDRKLWDCIAQVPLRDDDGNCIINFRKWMDGDSDGAYLTLVYIPKEGVSKQFRRFLFAHYLLKVWKVSVSREKGFAGREYRPETLVVVDEVHQVIDVPTIATLFIDLFKEPRKYSVRLFFTLHGWSSLAMAGRSIEGKIKQSILDNGANLIMLKGGRDAFSSLENFMGEMTIEDYDNLMGMEFCGIFSLWWKGCHVFQGKMLLPVDRDKSYKKYDRWDLYKLYEYISPFSRTRDEVRKANLARIKSMLKKALREETANDIANNNNGSEGDEIEWEEIRKAGGTKERKRAR